MANDACGSTRPGGNEVRVLVVDDSEIMCELATRMLQGFGFRVEVAYGGKQALGLLLTREFDVVLIDCQMPGVDGYDVVRTYRRAEPLRADGRRLPFIAVTGETAEECRPACLEAGMDDYLGKPFTAADLKRIVERWIHISKS
jgi:CheY-like chemotaxis protein